MIPSVIAASIASYSPLFQAFLPVHESDTCLCAYYATEHTKNQPHGIPAHMKDQSFYELVSSLSSVSFYALNWIFLFIIIRAVFQIRHMKDRLEIRLEMFFVVILWLIFDTV